MWNTLTTASILTEISQQEYDKYTALSTGSLYSGSMLLQMIINDTIQEVRGYVCGNPKNSVDIDETLIPARLNSTAKSIIIYKFQKRLAGKIADISEARKADYERAMKILDETKEGKFGIDEPATPVLGAMVNKWYGGSSTARTF